MHWHRRRNRAACGTYVEASKRVENGLYRIVLRKASAAAHPCNRDNLHHPSRQGSTQPPPHPREPAPQLLPLPILHSETTTELPSCEKLSGLTTTPMSRCAGEGAACHDLIRGPAHPPIPPFLPSLRLIVCAEVGGCVRDVGGEARVARSGQQPLKSGSLTRPGGPGTVGR